MTAVMIAIAEPRATELAAELELEGIQVIALVPPGGIVAPPPEVDAAVVTATRDVLTPRFVSACDRSGVRIVPLGDGDNRLLARYGLGVSLRADARGWEVAAALAADVPDAVERPHPSPSRVTVVWGPQGGPGRSMIAIQLAAEVARTGRHTALVDADTVAPSLALLLGLSDDAPGIAAACRRAELGALDSAELARLAERVTTSAGDIDVLGGINRPSRWPELSATRLRTTLQACRSWTEETIVDVSSAFDADDDATHDLSGPRRHGATVAALREADAIIAIASADPVGISRFLRDHAELRHLTAPTPITVVINQVRPGPLGIDARGQIRRTLERFAGIDDAFFLPFDQRACDAALLHARPMTDLTPRSPLVAGIRRLAANLGQAPQQAAIADSSRGSSRGARRLLPARAARGA